MQLTVVSRATLHILARGPDLASGAVDGRVRVCIEGMRESDTNAVTLRTRVLPSDSLGDTPTAYTCWGFVCLAIELVWGWGFPLRCRALLKREGIGDEAT